MAYSHYYHHHHPPSASKVLALSTLLPFAATLIFLAGITLTRIVISLAIATPLFVIFSLVLVPATLAISFAIAGFLTFGAFGVTSLSTFAWMAYVRRSWLPEQLEHAKRPAKEAADHVAMRSREAVEAAKTKAQELG